ncbi:SURF1 family protein [Parvularcula lutaonensis]|uniref:SURF1-like protein n=1 Tax=Parvularcula lutaonensis TaxID=491923 RepID=A0ABV7MC91_9PROT|nr:SURF1 family protein [Parvularcula lutaonensis]GGY50166.1 SURF1-like protein [Parvularcula lutaonensis]
MSFTPRPVLWAVSAVAVAILLTLGTWQVQRLQWKTDLIATVEARIDSPPVPLAQALAMYAAGEDIEYLPVRAMGGFPSTKVAHVFGTWDGQPGYYVFQAMRLDEPEGRTLIVNRGFVPQDQRAEAYPLPDAAAITGLARRYEGVTGIAAAVEPKGTRDSGTFYDRDLSDLAAYLAPGEDVLPFAIDSTLPTELPKGGTTRVEFRNAHLGYAITWYGLAAALIGVVFVMSRKRN